MLLSGTNWHADGQHKFTHTCPSGKLCPSSFTFVLTSGVKVNIQMDI